MIKYIMIVGVFVFLIIGVMATTSFIPPSPTEGSSSNLTTATLNVSVNGSVGNTYSFFNDGLVGWWRMDNSSSVGENDTRVYDWSGNGNNGTVYSGAIANSSGKFGGSYSFNGATGYMGLPAAISNNLGNDITVSAWVYSNPLSVSSVYRGIVTEAYSGDGNVEFELFLSGASHTLSGGFYDGSWRSVSEATGFPMGIWVHTAASYDGHYVRVYRDGVQVAISSDLSRALPSGTNGWRIGRRHDSGTASDMWNGSIDEVVIFNRTLSLDEVKALYNSSKYNLQRSLTGLNGQQSYTAISINNSGSKDVITRTWTANFTGLCPQTGNCNIDCSANSTLNTETTINGNLTLTGTGTFTLNTNLSFAGTDRYIIQNIGCNFIKNIGSEVR